MSAAVVESAVRERPAFWQNRTFLIIWLGHTISILGDGFHSVALGFWVLQTTGSAAAMATIMSVRTVAWILMGALAGTIVDRVDRRRLMITMNLVRFVLVLIVAYLIWLPGVPFAALVTLTGLTTVCGVFFGPAFQSSLVNIVGKEEVPRASSLLQVTNTLSMVIGPILGGTIVMVVGGWAAMVGDAATFLFSAGMLLLAGSFPSPRREGAARRSFWSDLMDGFAYIRQQPLVATLIALVPPINFFASAAILLLPVIAYRVWKVNSLQLGAIDSAFLLGFAGGAALLMVVAKRLRRRGWWIMIGGALTGFGLAAAVFAPSFATAVPLIIFTGLVNSIPNVLIQIIMQAEVPTEVQGRVFGTMNSLNNVASPIAMMAAGVLGDRFNPVLIAAGCGIIFALMCLVALTMARAVRDYN